MHKHSIITNIPIDPKTLYDYALSKSYHSWVDEMGTENNPSFFQRRTSCLTYEQAFKLIQDNKPHWTISFRNLSNIAKDKEDYWEFGGCNIGSNDYGDVFIWILVSCEEAEKIFEKFKLKREDY